MARSSGGKIVTDGLVLALDAANDKSYPGTGTTWTDLSGNGNNGTLVNGVGYNSGNSGSLTFDGSNDYVGVGDIGIDFGGIDVWVYLNNTITSSTSHMSLLGYGDYTQSQISFGAASGYATDETMTILQGTSGNYGRTYIKDTINSGWNNIVIQWNGSNFDFYINGASKTTYNGTQGQAIQETMNDFRLGDTSGAGGTTFNGKISITKIYNRALTDSEVLQNFNATRGRFGI